MESSIVPEFYGPDFADEKMIVRTEIAYEAVVELAKREGLLTGISSGAAAVAARQVAEAHPDECVVTVFPDNGLKYLNERFWSDNL